MEGFLRLRWPSWLRRVVTRACAIVPALALCAAGGEDGAFTLLLASQVVLSVALPFAIVPLVRLTSDRARMGEHVSPAWMRAASAAGVALVVAADAWLLVWVAHPR